MTLHAIKEHDIIPDEFAEVDAGTNSLQLVNVSSDGAYLHAKHEKYS